MLDGGLNALRANASQLFLSTIEPTTFAEAVSFAIGNADYGPGGIFVDPPAPWAPNGRKLTSITMVGTVTSHAMVNWWALCSPTGLLVHGTIAAPRVMIESSFEFVPVVIGMPKGV
ncbi:hypothetical protein GWG65_03465 [Bradyrhizobium sp. CSA207]|uniref:hypothetical protein n=1 Tax=Bradyrhizobium sp. CSA207 TaxID=2698826 RepID=UPI0023B0C093|nr:hypothetical protein [Bradyrhizobium sp. CSA207]MDE5440522.1 hypothetical protein [Bradyrhizobium sp. CSA207]